MDKSKTESVTAIENGTVIDHIEPGMGVKMIGLLELVNHHKRITVALNLPSKTHGKKDLIKLEDRILTEQEFDLIAIFAPNATMNLIRDYEVKKKFKVKIPDEIDNYFICPNKCCVTKQIDSPTHFYVIKKPKKIHLKCYYCSKESTLNDLVSQ